MTIYLAGKITGNPNYKEDFEAAERALTEAGETVMNPAILPLGWGYDSYMRMTHAMLVECDAICLLPNWMDSRGARVELMNACMYGKRIIRYSDIKEHGLKILTKGEALALLAMACLRAELRTQEG